MITKYITALAWIVGTLMNLFIVLSFLWLLTTPDHSKQESNAACFLWLCVIVAIPCWAWLIMRYWM